MIKNFEHKGLENYFFNGTKKGIQAQHAQKLADILDRLDAARDITDMKFPGSDLHQLQRKDERIMGSKGFRQLESSFQFQRSQCL